MPKKPVELRIIAEGFLVGIISGIAIKTGISIDQSSISLMMTKVFCKVTEGMQTQFNCWSFVVLLSALAVFITIFSIISEITKADNWVIGAILYAVGFFAGVLSIVIFV